jgi:hypothetical protein
MNVSDLSEVHSLTSRGHDMESLLSIIVVVGNVVDSKISVGKIASEISIIQVSSVYDYQLLKLFIEIVDSGEVTLILLNLE